MRCSPLPLAGMGSCPREKDAVTLALCMSTGMRLAYWLILTAVPWWLVRRAPPPTSGAAPAPGVALCARASWMLLQLPWNLCRGRLCSPYPAVAASL